MQPTSSGRWSSGLFEELRLSSLVYLDTVAEGCIAGLRERGCASSSSARRRGRGKGRAKDQKADEHESSSALAKAALAGAVSLPPFSASLSAADSTEGSGSNTPSFSSSARSSASSSSASGNVPRAVEESQPSILTRWLPQRLVSSLLPSLPKDALSPPSSTLAMSAKALAAQRQQRRQQQQQQQQQFQQHSQLHAYSPLVAGASAGIPASPLLFPFHQQQQRVGQGQGSSTPSGSPAFTALPPPSSSLSSSSSLAAAASLTASTTASFPPPPPLFTPLHLPSHAATTTVDASNGNGGLSRFTTPRGESGEGEGGGAFPFPASGGASNNNNNQFFSPHVNCFSSLATPSGALSFNAVGAGMATTGAAALLYPRISDVSTTCHLIGGVCGFPVETYASVTADGYVLTLIRIPRPESKRVVFFQHGLLDSASAWVSTGDLYSLAARAYASGCDVFLGNLRGSNDALGSNGIGANPADYGEEADEAEAAATTAAQKIGAAVAAAAAALTTEEKAEELSQATSQAIERVERATIKAKTATVAKTVEVLDSAVKKSRALLPESLHKKVVSVVDLASISAGLERPPSVSSVASASASVDANDRPADAKPAAANDSPSLGSPVATAPSSKLATPARPPFEAATEASHGPAAAAATTGLLRGSVSWTGLSEMARSFLPVSSSGAGEGVGAATRERSGSLASLGSASKGPRSRAGTLGAIAGGGGDDDDHDNRDQPAGTEEAASTGKIARKDSASSFSSASAPQGMVSPLRGQLGRRTMRFPSAENEGDPLAVSQPGPVPARDSTASTTSTASTASFSSFPANTTRARRSTTPLLLSISTPAPSAPPSPHKPLPADASASSSEEGESAANSPAAGAAGDASTEDASASSASSASSAPASPPILPAVFSTRQALAHVVGHSADGLPVHLTLHPRQDRYWSYDVFDHTLDVLAFMKTIRLIKTAEASLRKRLRGEDEGAAVPQAAAATTTMTAAADDCSIIGIGHSMGCAILTNYVLLSRALRRPHWLTKLILLSPAGLHKHLPFGTKPLLKLIYRLGLLKAERPFPMRSSFLQRLGSKILQDLKSLQGTGDLMAVIGSLFFGGERRNFVFNYVAVTDYPIGGTSQRVIRHGVQAIIARDFPVYDYGKKENKERYGSERAPSLREDYGLLFGLPIHIVAGGKDMLVPKQNLHETHALLNLIFDGSEGSSSARSSARSSSGGGGPSCTLTEFPSAGHLDLTLTRDDEIISHVLQEIDYTATAAAPTTPAGGGTGSSSSLRADEGARTYGGPDDILGLASFAKRRLREYLVDAAATTATTADGDGKDGADGSDKITHLSPLQGGRWIPAKEAARRHRWIMGLTNAEIVMEALDAEAVELGLTKG